MSRYGRLVRLFALTGGRTQPSSDVFTLITLITATQQPTPAEYVRLQPEHQRILHLCRRATAVVEVAARMDLPVSVITIMLSDLLEAGRITARPPVHGVRETTAGPDIALLQKVRDGLARL